MRDREGETAEEMLSLRRVEPAELDHLRPLVQSYFAYDGLTYGPHVDAAIGELVESPTMGHYFFFRSGDASVGYGALTYGFDAEVGGRLGVITDFFLVETARGKGLGPRFLELVVEHARGDGLRHLELVVLDGNDRARRLYERAGFRPSSGRQVMTRSLRAAPPDTGSKK